MRLLEYHVTLDTFTSTKHRKIITKMFAGFHELKLRIAGIEILFIPYTWSSEFFVAIDRVIWWFIYVLTWSWTYEALYELQITFCQKHFMHSVLWKQGTSCQWSFDFSPRLGRLFRHSLYYSVYSVDFSNSCSSHSCKFMLLIVRYVRFRILFSTQRNFISDKRWAIKRAESAAFVWLMDVTTDALH